MCALKSSGALLQDCFFYSSGPSRRVLCLSMSKIVQAEYKAKARFLALLRRRRFWSAAQRSLANRRFRSLTLQK